MKDLIEDTVESLIDFVCGVAIMTLFITPLALLYRWTNIWTPPGGNNAVGWTQWTVFSVMIACTVFGLMDFGKHFRKR